MASQQDSFVCLFVCLMGGGEGVRSLAVSIKQGKTCVYIAGVIITFIAGAPASNSHTHTHTQSIIDPPSGGSMRVA